MENNKHHIDHILQQQLENASVNADGIDWNSFNKRKRKKAIVFYRMLGLGLLGLMIAAGTIYYTLFKDESKFNSFTNSEIIINKLEVKPNENGFNNKNIKSDGSITNEITSNSLTETEEIQNSNKDKIQNLEIKTFKEATPVSNPAEKNILNTESSQISYEKEFIKINSKPHLSFFEYSVPVYKTEKVFGQFKEPESELIKPKKPSLQLEIQAGPSYSSPDFKVTESGKAFIHKDYQKIRKLAESAQTGFNINMGLLKAFGPFKYGIGIGYSQIEFNGNYNFNYSDKPVLDTDGKISQYISSTPQNIQFKSKQKLSFIEIPVNIQYMLWNGGKMNIGLKLGYVTQFLNTLSGELPNPVFLDKKESLSSENYKTRTSSIQTAILFEYKLKNNRSVLLVPEFRRGLGFKQVQSHFKTDFNYWGLNFNYRFAL